VIAVTAQLPKTTYLEGMNNPARINVVTINLYICLQICEDDVGSLFNVLQKKTFLNHFYSILRNEHSEAYRMKNKSASDSVLGIKHGS
jgi:hypothetical protein